MALDRNNKTINKYFSNTKSNVIEITEDKARNILNNHFNKMEKSKDWVGALALSITLLLSLITADFTHWLFSADTWEAIFVILFAASIFYLIYTAHNAIKSKDSVDNIIQDMENKCQ